MNKAIKKIELDLGGKIVSLTPEQAQNLKDALDDLFGKNVIKVIEKEYIRDSYPVPYPVPYRPIWEYQPYWYNHITCDMAGTGDNFIGNIYATDKVTCSAVGTLRLTG